MPEVMSIEVDEEFDTRPPSQPFGFRGPDGDLNIGLIAGIAVAVVLVIALILVVANPFGSDPPAVKVETCSPKNPLSDIQIVQLYSLEDSIAQDLQSSLDEWAKFYTTGDITDLEGTFDIAGSQYALLLNGAAATETTPAVKSAAEVKADIEALPVEPEVAKVEIISVAKVVKKSNLFTVRAVLTWTEPGKESSTYKWDVSMKKDLDSSTYLLNSIKTTDPAAVGALDFCDAVTLISKLDKDSKVTEKLNGLTGAEQKNSLDKLFDIRIKVWQTAQPAFLQSSATDSVGVIVSQYKQAKKLLEESESLEAFYENFVKLNEDDATTSAHAEVVSAAQSDDCTADISER